LERAQKLARLVDCPQKDKDKLVECLKEKTMDTLMNTHPNFYEWKHLEQNKEPITAWSPRVDVESAVPFLATEPIDVMTSGQFTQVPWIVGITDDEGATKVSAFLQDKSGVKEFEDQFEKLGQLMFGLHDGQSEAPKIMSKQVKDFYWGDKELDASTASSLSDAISDSAYSHPVDTACKVHAMHGNSDVYVYHFAYHGEHSLAQITPGEHPPKTSQTDMEFGVGNGDDLIYLFPILRGIFRPLNPDDLLFSKRIIEMLASFAETGKPQILMGEGMPPFVWDAMKIENMTHLDISNAMSMDSGLPNHRRMSFWQSMPVYWNSDRENYKPAPPPITHGEL
jgi:carboxylesterase type B